MASAPTHSYPTALLLSSDGATAYCLSEGSSYLDVIDTASMTLGPAIALGMSVGSWMALSPDGTKMYVPGSGGMAVVDFGTFAVTGISGFTDYTQCICFSPDGTTAYAPNGDYGGALWKIDVASATATAHVGLPVGGNPTAIAISPDGSTVYIGQTDMSVTVVDTGSFTVTTNIATGWGGFSINGMAVTPDGTKLYSTTYGSSVDAIGVIDTTSHAVTTFSPGDTPTYHFWDIGFTSDGTIGWAVDYTGAHTFLFDPSTNSTLKNIATNGGGSDGPTWAAISPDKSTLYVSQFYNSVVESYPLASVDLSTGTSDWSVDWSDATLTVLTSEDMGTGTSERSVDWADATLDIYPIVELTGVSNWSIDWADATLEDFPLVELTGTSDWSIDWSSAALANAPNVELTGVSNWSFYWASTALGGVRPKVSLDIQNPTPEALKSAAMTRIVSVQVWNGHQFLREVPITGGSVTVDQTATVRRTHSLTIVDHGISPENPDSLVPEEPTDLLHPLSQNEIHLFRGFRYENGEEVLYPLGVFGMTKPVVTDSGSDVTIAITGQDRSAWITRNKWIEPYVITPGADLAKTVIAILNDRWTGPADLDMSRIEPTDPIPHGKYGAGLYMTLPATTFGADPSTGNDPWADLQTLVMAAGMELFFDVLGRPVLQSILQPSLAGVEPIMRTLYEDDSPNSTLTKVAMTYDETGTISGDVALGNGSGTDPDGLAVPPVTSRSISPTDGKIYIGVWNTNPASRTYYDPGNERASRVGRVPYVFTTQAIPGFDDTEETAQIKINAAALAQLQFITSAYLNPTFECIPNPALQENDMVTLVRARAGVNGDFIVQAMVIPLDVASPMQVTLKPKEQVALS